MKENETEQIKNGKDILKNIKDLQGSYESYMIDEHEEELTFIDKINKLIQAVMGDSSISIYEALDENKLNNWKQRRFTRWIRKQFTSNLTNIFYFFFLITITGFLVSESVEFYAVDGVVNFKTILKAVLTEVSFIFLSGYKSIGWLQKTWVGILRGGIFSLMLFVISSQTLTKGTNIISENQSIANQVHFLETQIADKEKQIDYYKSKNWPRNVTRITIEKELLIKKMIVLQDQQAGGKNISVAKVEKYKMYGRAVFRILLLLITVLITRRIFIF